MGTPVYSNDDGSGTFVQQTLYKFTVDETFKGLPEGTREVWVDPGSYTSCYANYQLGTKLLVFASAGRLLPVDTAAMTIAKPAGKQKPLPPGFDPKAPVYYAPECTGTRDANSAVDDIAWLRAWKRSNTQTSIQGLVVDSFDRPLPGTKVTAHTSQGDLAATADGNGNFLLEPVKPGNYELSASLPGYSLGWSPQLTVQERACGYARLSMGTNGAISGMVVDRNGRPAAGVQIDLSQMSGKEETFPPVSPEKTSASGFFRYTELPAGSYLLGVNLRSKPNVDAPFARTYAPGVADRSHALLIHLQTGQQLSGVRLQLPTRLRTRTVHVQVKWSDGRSAGAGVAVESDDDESSLIDIEDTKKGGSASVRCFAAKTCLIEAKEWLTSRGEDAVPQVAASLPRQIKAGDVPVSITLVLTEKRSGWDQ